MKALLQRVTEARAVMVGSGEVLGEIAAGVAVLVCAEPGDGAAEAELFARKVANMRIFEDAAGKMNLSVKDVGGAVLAISQFTLAADWRNGNRPGFSAAAPPELAEPQFEMFCDKLAAEGVAVARGRFRTRMRIELHNDGPTTIWIDSNER